MEEELKVKRGSLDDLTPDDRNMNKHTSYGMSLIEKSIRKHKFGRSILVDKNDRIIGGNGVTETAASIGATKTIVVETTGDELVVVKRTDVDLDSQQGREMALADNATAVADIDFDSEQVRDIEEEYDIDSSEWGVVANPQAFTNLPEELDGLDISPDELKKLQGDDEVEYQRVIIVYKGKEQTDKLCALLHLDTIGKVVYKLEELLNE